MKTIQYASSLGIPPKSMEEEFLTHKNGSEWWYSTGYLNDDSGKMFSFQFTLGKIIIYGVKFHILISSITDFETGKHYHEQDIAFWGRNITTTSDEVSFGKKAAMSFSKNEMDAKGNMQLTMTGKNFSISLHMAAVKPPVWHCDNGVLKMGILDDPKQTTYYYSYTNLATTGNLSIDGKIYSVSGKSWFDKQGGTYTLTDRRTCWEWFSVRFFDNEEVMLFAFPQDNYFDGTFIEKSGKYRRLNEYSIQPVGFTEAGGYKFSNGWNVLMKGIKDEEYTIVPKINGQFNVFFFELLAEVKNKSGSLSDMLLLNYCRCL